MCQLNSRAANGFGKTSRRELRFFRILLDPLLEVRIGRLSFQMSRESLIQLLDTTTAWAIATSAG